MCTDAYREALTRDLSSTPAPSQRHATEAGRGVAVAGAAAGNGPAMALAKDATVVNGEAIDQR